MKLHIWITILLTLSFNEVIYSDSVVQLTATPYWNSFASHDGFDGTTHYPDNYTREWLITGETANYSILINITHCAIENAKGKCLFDYLSMYDGSNSNASVLQETCCTNIPSFIYKPIVRSTDGTMYIVFNTDLTINDTGFKINYILEGAPTTTLSTSTPSTTTVVVLASVQTEDNTLIYIIIACAVTGVLVIIIIILICVICCKKKANNSLKQQISKKLRRSTERPVVVTSENTSHLIIEDEACDPRVSTVQNRSPPPAYATIVDDGNNVHAQSVSNTDSQGKEILPEQSDNTSSVTMNTNNELKVSSTKTVKNRSTVSSSNNNIIEKSNRKNKTGKEKKSNEEKIQVNKNDIDKGQAPSNLKYDNKPRPHSDVDIHTMSKSLTKSQNQEDNNDSKRKLLSYAKSTHVMSETIVLVKEDQNEKAAYNNTKYLNSRSVTPVQPADQIVGIEGALITSMNDTHVKPRIMAEETPVHKRNRKAIKPGSKPDDKTITLKERDDNQASTIIHNIDDKPVVQAHNNNRKTNKSGNKSEEILISQDDKTDHQPISPANNHWKTFKSENKIDAMPISPKNKHDKNSIFPEHNEQKNMKSGNNNDATQTSQEVKNDDQPNTPSDTNDQKANKLDNKRKVIRILQKDTNDENAYSTTHKYDDQPISAEHQNNRKTTKASNTQEAKPISQEDSDVPLMSPEHKNDQKKIKSENITDAIPISHKDTNDDESILLPLKNDRKTNEIKSKDVVESITTEKTTDYPVTTQPANYKEENTPTKQRDCIETGKNHPKMFTVLTHSNAQPIPPRVENDTNKTNDTSSVSSNNHHKRLTTSQTDLDTKPVRSIISNDTESLNNTVDNEMTENVLNDKTKELYQNRYTLHDQENENEIMENEAEITLSTNFRKHPFYSENETLTKRDMSVVREENNVHRDLNAKPVFTRSPNDKNDNWNKNSINHKPSKAESVDNESVQEPSVFTVFNGNTQNFVKAKDIKSSTVPASYRNNFMTNNRPTTSSNQPKIAEEHYLDKMKMLKSIYYSHSNYGLSDKNLHRMRSQLDLLRPQTSNVNPWLFQPTSHNTSDISNKQVTKATVIRRMRNMGVQEMDDDDLPQLIPKSQAFNIIKSRTTLCDDDIAQSRKKILPPLKGVPKQKFPDLPKLWQPV